MTTTSVAGWHSSVKRVLVTGANGFIGTALCKRVLSEGWSLTAAVRPSKDLVVADADIFSIDRVNDQTKWVKGLEGVDVVVHLAARVHVMADASRDPLKAYRQVNALGTKHLAEQAARAGVKRMVYLSSVKVNGEENDTGYCESNAPSPEDAYGLTKLEGEDQLKAVTDYSGLEHVIIRPPLVYGPGVKANFLALMELIHRKMPLPLAGVRNQRSFIYIDNLVDGILACMGHPAAAGQTYLISDDRDLATPELIRMIAASLETSCFLFPLPGWLLRCAGFLAHKGDTIKRLLDSLTVDISKIKTELGWLPPVSVEDGLRHTAKWFKQI